MVAVARGRGGRDAPAGAVLVALVVQHRSPAPASPAPSPTSTQTPAGRHPRPLPTPWPQRAADRRHVQHPQRDRHAGYNLVRIAGEIAAVDPDVVLLQEVDKSRLRSHFVDEADYLSSLLDMRHVFASNVERAGRRTGDQPASTAPPC